MSVEAEKSVTERVIPHRRFRPVFGAAATARSGLRDGEPENCRRSRREFFVVMAQLALLQLVFDAYRIESRTFRVIVLLATAVLPVHYLAHYRWKKPLFVAASILGLVVVNGVSVAGGVIGLAFVLLLIASAPLPWLARSGIIAAFAIGLAVLRSRADSVGITVPTGVVTVVATAFMFRMIIYLYELKHARRRESLVDTLCYFLLLPNWVFPLFPVVDYRALQRGYFARGIHEIQRRGLQMMSRGVMHLLLYRVVDRMLLISADAVHSPLSLAGYMVFNYLLYLRVSGQFHMACGMLHLFGFELPDTHHNYLLASSFTDYWRRINIYWKDFMVRIVFNPVVFRLKRWPRPVALAVATAVVFVATWFLHAYQSFWLRGRWGFNAPDALFWGILGLLVVVNVQFDARRGTRRGAVRAPLPLALRWSLHAGATAGTFATIAVLWSLWSSPSVEAWVAMIRRGFAS
jgi:alginate O-acetyltransferase complex protein AlgI